MTPKVLQICIFFHFRCDLKPGPKKTRFPSCFTYENGAWLGAESNRRHVDFQSTALPTELPSRDGADRVAPWGFHYARNVTL